MLAQTKTLLCHDFKGSSWKKNDLLKRKKMRLTKWKNNTKAR